MSMMTSFKRKRIEKWCEEVGQYLKNGTICQSVIGNIAEDAIRGVALVPANGSARIDNTDIANNNLNAKVDLALKKASQALATNDMYYTGLSNANGTGNGAIPNQTVNGNSFPVVKFAYSHYHEQRRKIDRLVQGLPVLTANGLSTLDRPSSRDSTEDHVPIIIVNGEEPVRSNHTRSRSSSQPRRDSSHYPAKRASPLTPTSNSNNIQQLPNSRNPLESSSSAFRLASSSLQRNGSGGKLYGLRTQSTSHVGVTVDPGLAISANDRLSRIKTAPSPNRNLHRARQRILTRRGNRILEPSSQIPLQNCWAMAELTW